MIPILAAKLSLFPLKLLVTLLAFNYQVVHVLLLKLFKK